MTYSQARAAAAKINTALNGVQTAIQSPRCYVRWELDVNGDQCAVWTTENCTGEMRVNVSALNKEMDRLVTSFGSDVCRSRKGNRVRVEIPQIGKKS